MSLGPVGMSGGMDINSMVSKIVDAERVPKQQRIDNDRTTINASISAYGRLRESLDTMKNLMANFRQEKAFAVRTVESTDDNIVSATATTDAIAGKYAIDVLQLAQSHKVASDVLPEDAKFTLVSCRFRLVMTVLISRFVLDLSSSMSYAASMALKTTLAFVLPSLMMSKDRVSSLPQTSLVRIIKSKSAWKPKEATL